MGLVQIISLLADMSVKEPLKDFYKNWKPRFKAAHVISEGSLLLTAIYSQLLDPN